jgi:RTA1 like protein
MQSLLTLVAPALFAATIYMTLGRIIRATHAESYSIVRVKWITKLFVAGDVLTFFIQGGGGGLMASGDSKKLKMGQDIILGGLFLQIILFGVFVLASIIFHLRMRKNPTRKSFDPELKWKKTLYILYTVSAIIMVRNIFRVVEYIGGRDGPLLRVEWPIYVFDAVLMAATMAVFLYGYPSAIRPKILDSENSSTELAPPETIHVSGHANQEK